MSEKDLEQFNADVQENEAATAAPVDNASPEAIGEAIKEINGEADASAAPEKADDELQVGVIKPIATGKPESKRALKKAEKKKAKELKNIYHVSNWQIIKNYRNYNQQERKHYKYIFRRRITEKVTTCIIEHTTFTSIVCKSTFGKFIATHTSTKLENITSFGIHITEGSLISAWGLIAVDSI